MRLTADTFDSNLWRDCGNRIKEQRRALHLNRDYFSQIIGISEKGLGQIERGEISCSVLRLLSISKALNVSMDYLLCGVTTEDATTSSSSKTQSRIFDILSTCNEFQLNTISNIIQSMMPYIDKK